MLLLPETGEKITTEVAEKWRAGIEKLQVNTDKEEISFHCSFGVSTMKDDDNFDLLLKKAEVHLQEAKASGGNRVVCRG